MDTENTIYDIVIIGGGPAGATAALYTARSGLKTIVIDKGLTTGALGITGRIANYPGVSGHSGAELLTTMREQAKSFGAAFITDRIIGVDLQSELKSAFGNNGVYSGKALIIATGSMGRGKQIKGEGEYLGRGVSYCATCDAAFFKGQEVLVAGNSDEAVEEALFLTNFASKIHFLNPAEAIHAPDELVKELIGKKNVHIYPEATLKEIRGNGKVEGAVFSRKGEDAVSLQIDGAFIYLQGGRPITDFLQGQLAVSESGCLIVDREYQTAIPNVYAIGDVLCNHIKQVVIAAGEGAVAAMSAEKAIRGRKKAIVDWAK
jgi:thioredoxin reductase (NADPH)